jgi:hypothetical protein
MSGTATLGLEVRTSGLDNAVRQMNNFVSQADKAASAAARLEKSWGGVSRMMSGFNVGGAGGMDAMAKAAADCVKVFGEFALVTNSVGKASSVSASQVKALSASAREITSVMGLASTAQTNMAKTSKASQESLSATLKLSLKDISDSVSRTEQMVGDLCDSLDGLKGSSSNASKEVKNIANVMTGTGAALTAFGAPIGPIITGLGTLANTTNEVVGSIETAEQRLDRLSREHARAAREVDKFERALNKLDTGFKDAKGDKEKEKELVEDLIRLMPALKGYYDGTTESIQTMKKELKEYLAIIKQEQEEIGKVKSEEVNSVLLKNDKDINSNNRYIDMAKGRIGVGQKINIEYKEDIRNAVEQYTKAVLHLENAMKNADDMLIKFRKLGKLKIDNPEAAEKIKALQDQIVQWFADIDKLLDDTEIIEQKEVQKNLGANLTPSVNKQIYESYNATKKKAQCIGSCWEPS